MKNYRKSKPLSSNEMDKWKIQKDIYHMKTDRSESANGESIPYRSYFRHLGEDNKIALNTNTHINTHGLRVNVRLTAVHITL